MKIPKQAYTTEFKELAVKRIKDGQSVSHPCPPQAALQGDDGLEARPAGSRKPAGQKLHAGGAESGLDIGHHLPVD